MSERAIDWRAYLNKLVFCYSCGRFGMPRKGERKVDPPRGWTVLYQPHADTPAGLLVCSDTCREKVQAAIAEGPVYEPLEIAANVMMTPEMRDQMMEEAMLHAIEEGRLNDLFSEALEEKGEGDGQR